MATINRQRLAADIEGDFAVFLIGMRVNKPWKLHKWLPPFLAMPRMLRELDKDPELGLLGYRQLLANPFSPMVIQYWRSFEHLERFARAKDNTHFPAWVKFNKSVGSNGDVGIWHETYLVKAGQYEAVYNNMPALGLGKASKLVPASGRRESAPGRLGLADPGESAADEPGATASP
jgi:hypothetical protein